MGLLTGLLAACAAAQVPQQQEPNDPKRLPNGRLQSEEMLKSDHRDNLKDIEHMRKLLDGVEAELKKYEHNVLPLQSLKDLEEIEKISRRVRGRLRRF